MFDPERDEDPGPGRFYLRLLTVLVISAAGCVALWPAVTGFSAGPDHDYECLAIKDGWHHDKSGPSDAAVSAAYSSYPPLPNAAERSDPAFMAKFRAESAAIDASPVVQRANAHVEWANGAGKCVHESRHRLILSGIGLVSLAAICTGVALFRRTRTNLRRRSAVLAGT